MTGYDWTSFSRCANCEKLDDLVTSFHKYGADDQDVPLPPEAMKLRPLGDVRAGSEEEKHHLERCPYCGALYSYDSYYDYYVNGSEDEEVLYRLTPPEARDRITADEYGRVMTSLKEKIFSDDRRIAGYALRALLLEALISGDEAAAAAIAKNTADRELLKRQLQVILNSRYDGIGRAAEKLLDTFFK